MTVRYFKQGSKMRRLNDKKEETTRFMLVRIPSPLIRPEMTEFFDVPSDLAFKIRADLTLVSLAESNIYRMSNVSPERAAQVTYRGGS